MVRFCLFCMTENINMTENQELVAQLFAENPQTYAVSASRELDIDRRSLRRIMCSMWLKVYIPQLVHALVEDNGDRRSQFCELLYNNLMTFGITSFGLMNQLSNCPAIWMFITIQVIRKPPFNKASKPTWCVCLGWTFFQWSNPDLFQKVRLLEVCVIDVKDACKC